MLEKLIIRLENEGKLKKQKAGIVQVEVLLKNAMLKAGRALLLMKGYIPDDGAQHKTIVDITAIVLGEKYKGLSDHFESMRRKRNEITYKGGAMVPKSEASEAFESAIALVRKILEQAKAANPQIELEL